MPDNQRLNVVDVDGNVVGTETREHIHLAGLLHREVHVWFYTPRGEIIFQHRAKDKDTFPDLLDATVGGHVEIDADYESAAVEEVEEETGIRLTPNDLTLLFVARDTKYDERTGKTNDALRAVYVYRYEGNVLDLRIEEGKALGFEVSQIEAVLRISDKDKKRFIPYVFEDTTLKIFEAIKKLL